MPENIVIQPNGSQTTLSGSSAPATPNVSSGTEVIGATPAVSPVTESQPIANIPVVNTGVIEKLSDPIDKLVASSNPAQTSPITQTPQPPTKLVNKNFWRSIFIFLILLPLVTAMTTVIYQYYLNWTISRQVTQAPPLEIDPRLVVTPDLLPLEGADELPEGWKRYTNTLSGYSFGYPEDWTINDTNVNAVTLQPVASISGSFTFSIIPTTDTVTGPLVLANFVQNQDTQSAIRINVATESAQTTNGGLPVVIRQITQGSELTISHDAYIGLDQKVLRVLAQGDPIVLQGFFEDIVKSVTPVSKPALSSNGLREYTNDFGYSLKYPPEVTLRSNDKSNSESSNLSKSANIVLFPTTEIENTTGFANSLSLQLSDTQPGQTATQSATRDFGTREFKAYEVEGLVRYVGQLSSGNWLQISLSYNSNVDQRSLMTQVLENVTLKETEQLP